MQPTGTPDLPDSTALDMPLRRDTRQGMPAQATGDLRPGESIGQYRVIRLIAKGGMANVYLAHHRELEVTRAIKVLKPGFSEDARTRLRTEAKISAHLQHPNIVQIHGMDQPDGRPPFLEMEFVDGWSLKDLLAGGKCLPPAAAVAIALLVCRALDHAWHQRVTLYSKPYDGLVHRDIKPANILISRNGTVKLADFGIARPAQVNIHTVDSRIMGTFAYLSPEQLSGSRLDQRTDIYALGAVLYEALRGERAFPQSSVVELIQSKSLSKYPPLINQNKAVPAELVRIVDKCLQIEQDKRFASAVEMAEALTALLPQLSAGTPEEIVASFACSPTAPPTISGPALSKKTMRIIIATAAGMLCVAAIAAGLLLHNRPPHKPLPASAGIPSQTTEADSITDSFLSASAESVSVQTHDPLTAGNTTSLPPKQEDPALRHDTLTRKEHESNVPAQIKELSQALARNQLENARLIADTRSLDDGYYQLLRGITYYQLGVYDKARTALSAALVQPSPYNKSVQAEASYYWAKIIDAAYRTKPNVTHREKATAAWDSYYRAFCTHAGTHSHCDEVQAILKELDY